MRRLPLLVLLLATACPGGGTKRDSKTTTTTTTTTDDPGTSDAALAARKAYSNPGGMWLPRQMTLPQHAQNFAAMGVAIDPGVLSDPLAAPLGAVVSLDHCTGSFVSPDGLII